MVSAAPTQVLDSIGASLRHAQKSAPNCRTRADVMATLFDPLRRHSTERRATAGNLGLGLFIVREIARAHGGEVTALADQGSIRFRLVLPKMAVSV